MSVKSGQAVTVLFTTQNPTTGAAADATGTPTGTLYVNGTANGAAVTVNNIATGVYKAALTLPALTAGDIVSLRIAATVAAVAGEGIVWQEVSDTTRLSDGVALAATQGPVEFVGQVKITANTALQGALHIRNNAANGHGINVYSYDGFRVEGSNVGMRLAGGNNQGLYILSDQAASTVYIEGPTRGGKGIAISSPSSYGSDYPNASGIYIQTENGHPGILFDFSDVADALKVVGSNEGNWTLDAELAAMARTGADGDTLETLSDQIDGIGGGGLTAQEVRDAMKLAPTAGAPAAGSIDDHLDDMPADVWAYSSRTLTQSSAAVAAALAGSSLSILRGDTFSASFTDLGDVQGYGNIWFTVKASRDSADSAAMIQIDRDTGLIVVNGVAATANQGSITVDDAPTGDLTIALNASVTAALPVGSGYYYDIQWQTAAGAIHTLTSGTCAVTADVTKAVA